LKLHLQVCHETHGEEGTGRGRATGVGQDKDRGLTSTQCLLSSVNIDSTLKTPIHHLEMQAMILAMERFSKIRND
jgi:hypothetical protein